MNLIKYWKEEKPSIKKNIMLMLLCGTALMIIGSGLGEYWKAIILEEPEIDFKEALGLWNMAGSIMLTGIIVYSIGLLVLLDAALQSQGKKAHTL